MSSPAEGSLVEGFLSSWVMVLVSEIGDKTFFIACLMAMRYRRMIVFAGAISALGLMTVLSSLMGVLVPSLVSVRITQALAVALFGLFGAKILYDALRPGAANDDDDDEMAEAAAVIGKKDAMMEEGQADAYATGVSPAGGSGSRSHSAKPLTGGGGSSSVATLSSRVGQFISPVFLQAFTLTFVAEWGDRSQLATIALAAAKHPLGVTLGGILGHSICTGAAVLFGNVIAARISHRTINITGGALFLFFSALTLYQLIFGSHPIEEAAAHGVALKY